jgi:hypothetical protein
MIELPANSMKSIEKWPEQKKGNAEVAFPFKVVIEILINEAL